MISRLYRFPLWALACCALATTATPLHAQGESDGVAPEDASKRILLIGDSHTQGAFGWALDYLLRDGVEGSVVATYAVCASSPISWIKGYKHFCGSLTRGEGYKIDSKKPGLVGRGLKGGTQRPPVIMSLLRQHKPDTIVIALGENLKGMSPERTSKTVAALAKRLECYKRGVETEDACRDLDLTTQKVQKDLSCVWVLPHFSRSKGTPKTLARLYKNVGDALGDTCRTLDSRPLTCKQGYKDTAFICDSGNYHLTPRRYRLWAIGTMEKLTEMLDLPLSERSFTNTVRTRWKFDPLPEPEVKEGAILTPEGRINWVPYGLDTLKAAAEKNRPVFVDFTADWCAVCKVHEKTILETDPVRKALTETGIMPMVGDYTSEDEVIGQALEKLGRNALPTYAIYMPDGTFDLMPEDITIELIVERLGSASKKFPPSKFK